MSNWESREIGRTPCKLCGAELVLAVSRVSPRHPWHKAPAVPVEPHPVHGRWLQVYCDPQEAGRREALRAGDDWPRGKDGKLYPPCPRPVPHVPED